MDIELLELYKRIVDIWKSAENDLDTINTFHFWAEAEVEEAVIMARDAEIAAIDEQIRKIHLETKEVKSNDFEEKREILFQYCDEQHNCEKCGFHWNCNDWDSECEEFVANVEKDYKFYREHIEED